MLKKTITYNDYNGVERTEDFYFNLTKAELMEMELGMVGGMSSMLQKIVQSVEVDQIVAVFKQIILKSYGEKSPDGRRFMKSPELTDAFVQTEAYSELFVELASATDKALEFSKGIMPEGFVEQGAAANPETYMQMVPNAYKDVTDSVTRSSE